jgi:hypothetical protein
VLLVISDLLVFEILLSATADPGASPTTGAAADGLAALVLRGGIPPAHAWLPPALGAGEPADRGAAGRRAGGRGVRSAP